MSIQIASNRVSSLMRALNTARHICRKAGVANPPVVGGMFTDDQPPRRVIILDAKDSDWQHTNDGEPVGLFLE